MKTRVIYVESSQFSRSEKSRIEKSVRLVSADSSKMFRMYKPVNFVFYRFGKRLRGLAQAKDWITVTLPKGKIDYVDLESVVYHELHHIVRGYTEYLEKGEHFLLNSLFSEGLAVMLQIEKRVHKNRSYRYSPVLVRKWIPKMKKELYSTTYDYQAWFQGKGKPARLGYRIGKYLIDEIRKYHPNLTHVDLVKKNARDLLKLSKVKF